MLLWYILSVNKLFLPLYSPFHHYVFTPLILAKPHANYPKLAYSKKISKPNIPSQNPPFTKYFLQQLSKSLIFSITSGIT